MSDLLEANISTVEDLFKSREPLSMPAIYFIQPSPQCISRLLEDFKDKKSAVYPSAHLFFSSKVLCLAAC